MYTIHRVAHIIRSATTRPLAVAVNVVTAFVGVLFIFPRPLTRLPRRKQPLLFPDGTRNVFRLPIFYKRRCRVGVRGRMFYTVASVPNAHVR